MRRIALMALFAIACGLTVSVLRVGKSLAEDESNTQALAFDRVGAPLSEVLAEAKRSDRLVFVAFFAEGCGPCKHLEETTLKSLQVKQALAKFVTVRYDDGQPAALSAQKTYGVQAFPTLLVLSPAGVELDEVGRDDPGPFVEELERIRSGRDTIASLRKDVAENPRDAGSLLKLASKLANRRPDEAFTLAETAIANTDPAEREVYAKALLELAYIEANRARVEEAMAKYERLLIEFWGTAPASLAPLLALNILPEADPQRGLRYLDKAIAIVGPDVRPSLEYTRGYLYYRAAEAEWLKRGNEAGDEPEALNAVAWECYLRHWHTREAIAWARRAAELSSRAPHILDTLACLLFRDGSIDEAVSLLGEALQRAESTELRQEIEERLVQFQAVQGLRAKHSGDEHAGD